MKFKAEQYQIVYEALSKLNPDNENNSIYKFSTFIGRLKEHATEQTKKLQTGEALKQIILEKKWENIPEVNLDTKQVPLINDRSGYNYRYRGYQAVAFFSDLDKKNVKIVQDYCMSKGFDLFSTIQEYIYNFHKETSYNDENLGRRYVEDSKNYMNLVIYNDFNAFKTAKQKKMFNSLVVSSINFGTKDSNRISLKLIRAGVEQNDDQKEVLTWFKAFLDENKTINPQAKTDFDYIKEKIKDWDMSQVFSSAEKKMLYAKNDGIAAKRVSGMFYDLDLNFIKKAQKMKGYTISRNLRTLVEVIPKVLGELPEYVDLTCIFEDPLVQINILFEKDVKESQIEVMNKVMENVLASKEEMEEEELYNKIKTVLLAAFLDENLSTKEDKPKRNKI